MSNRTDTELLYDIQEALRRIKAYTHEMTYKEFLLDTRTQDAVIRNIEIIGEATKKIICRTPKQTFRRSLEKDGGHAG